MSHERAATGGVPGGAAPREAASPAGDRPGTREAASREVRVLALEGLPEIRAGDDLASFVAEAARGAGLRHRDVVVVAHKVVSKAEGRVEPGVDRRAAALRESARVLRRAGDMVISETRHGFVCANAGVDASNVEGDHVVLLPVEPDGSARRLRARLRHLTGMDVAVIVSDTFGRAWRLGQTNVAIGVAGIEPFVDLRGTTDDQGRDLTATRICVADEIAAAAEMVMGKTRRVPAAIVRGAPVTFGRGAAAEIVRPPGEDLFR
ncbi:coenzyme F420-0:L-glutamate ligase [soil metagenome]